MKLEAAQILLQPWWESLCETAAKEATLREDGVLVIPFKVLYQAAPEHRMHCDKEPFWTR